jgi:hypothetical protein
MVSPRHFLLLILLKKSQYLRGISWNHFVENLYLIKYLFNIKKKNRFSDSYKQLRELEDRNIVV